MLKYAGRTTNARLLSILLIVAVAWIWLTFHEVLHAHVEFSEPLPSSTPTLHRNKHASLPPSHISNVPCKVATVTQTEPLSQTIFPIADLTKNDSWVGENNKMLKALFRCMEMNNCAANQNKVVILGSYHFRGALWGWNGGEDIWAHSTIMSLRDMGYSFLYSFNMDRTVQLYQMIPDLVIAILVEGPEITACWDDEDNCLLSEQNPYGIPAWKLFAFHFWTGPDTPLGRNWTLSPEPYILEGHPENVYLGYSVEPSCLSQPFVPHDDRDDQVYVMSKRLTFLAEGSGRAWPPHFYEAASNATGIHFVMGATSDVGDPEVPPALHNYGIMNQKDFLTTVSQSLVLLGVGRPVTSPTPYEALCLGVPFVNPILNWDRDHPEDRTQWDTQHGMLKLLDPPYVYNVFKDDLVGFVEAIEDAIANPIERYVLGRMRMSSVTTRLQTILETDWKGRAAQLLEQWNETHEGPLFIL